jgi:hypothetical protein
MMEAYMAMSFNKPSVKKDPPEPLKSMVSTGRGAAWRGLRRAYAPGSAFGARIAGVANGIDNSRDDPAQADHGAGNGEAEAGYEEGS